MSYLNPPYPTNFQELCACYPVWYLDVFEMRQILKTEGRLLDGVCASIETIVGDNFILTADETTIRGWEETLGITHSQPMTLDQRRAVVISHFVGTGHIGEPEIRAIISAYTTAQVTVEFDRGVITVSIVGEIFGEDNLLDTLQRRIPAHLALNMSIDIRRTFHHFVDFAVAGAIGSRCIGGPVANDRTAISRQDTAGSAFCYSRITSKLRE